MPPGQDGLHVHTWPTGGSIYNFSMHRDLQVGRQGGEAYPVVNIWEELRKGVGLAIE